MIKYTFKYEDTETGESVIHTFYAPEDNDSWGGYDGPMWKFFDFLKGCGFVFDKSTEIGVNEVKKDVENFRSAAS